MNMEMMSMNPILLLFKTCYIAKVYKDGDTHGFVWQWFNPLSWIIAPVIFFLSCLLTGIPDTWKYRYDNGFGIKPYFINNPDKLKWL